MWPWIEERRRWRWWWWWWWWWAVASARIYENICPKLTTDPIRLSRPKEAVTVS
jgi:hypothetical protein